MTYFVFAKFRHPPSSFDVRSTLLFFPISYYRLFFIFLLTFLFCFHTSAQTTQETDTDDLQIWSETTFVVPIRQKVQDDGTKKDSVNLNILATLRTGRKGINAVDRRIGVGFDFRLNDTFVLSPSYYFRVGNPTSAKTEKEHRLRIDLTAEKKASPVTLKWRGRIEHRIRLGSANSTRIRNKGTLQIPVKKDGENIISPFVAEEVFFDTREGRFSGHEFTAGFSRRLTSRISADIFYIRKDNRSGDIRTINGIGINLKVRLKN